MKDHYILFIYFFFTNSIVVLVKMTTEQLQFHSGSYRCTMDFFFLKRKVAFV